MSEREEIIWFLSSIMLEKFFVIFNVQIHALELLLSMTRNIVAQEIRSVDRFISTPVIVTFPMMKFVSNKLFS